MCQAEKVDEKDGVICLVSMIASWVMVFEGAFSGLRQLFFSSHFMHFIYYMASWGLSKYI